MDPLSTTDHEDGRPALPKETLEEYRRLLREYQYALNRNGGTGMRASRSALDAQEMARANLRHFERRHGLTESDPRLG